MGVFGEKIRQVISVACLLRGTCDVSAEFTNLPIVYFLPGLLKLILHATSRFPLPIQDNIFSTFAESLRIPGNRDSLYVEPREVLFKRAASLLRRF